MQVYIDPRSRISYASYYIEGLYRVFSKRKVQFSANHFKTLIQNQGIDDFDQYFAFVVEEESKQRKIVIDYRDKDHINLNALSWCDIYGKVNYNRRTIGKEVPINLMNIIIPIGPNFGVKIWSDIETLYMLLKNYFSVRNMLPVNFRTFLAGYNWMRKRPHIGNYKDGESQSNYIFFISTLYSDQYTASSTNYFRAQFIRTCKSSVEKFQGGLLASPSHPLYKEYSDVVTGTYFQPEEYLSNISKTALVFNTPAAWNCLGWKLGEFFSMGKAIISTPLMNEMPYPLQHGKNIHFVYKVGEIYDAVKQILTDTDYRMHLENGAKEYYLRHLAPEITIGRLIEFGQYVQL